MERWAFKRNLSHRGAKFGLKHDCYMDFSLNAKAFALLEVKVDLLCSKRAKCLDRVFAIYCSLYLSYRWKLLARLVNYFLRTRQLSGEIPCVNRDWKWHLRKKSIFRSLSWLVKWNDYQSMKLETSRLTNNKAQKGSEGVIANFNYIPLNLLI